MAESINNMHNNPTSMNSSGTPLSTAGVPIGSIQITGNAGGTARYDSGASHPCRKMIVIAESGATDVFINIGAAATTSSFPVLASTYLPLSFDDINLIYVQSASGKKLNVIAFN